MKIGIISNLYPPFVRGGAEMMVSTVAEGLRDNLHHVFVISTQPRGSLATLWPEQRELRGVKVYRFFPWNLYYYMNDYAYPGLVRSLWHVMDIFNLHSYMAVRSVLLKEKPDVVITHNLMGIGFLIPLLLRRLGIRHIHTIHDVQLYNPSGIIIKGREHNWLQTITNALGYPWLMRTLMGSPESVISPSEFLSNFYRRQGFFLRSHLVVIRNPVDFPDHAMEHSQAPELRLTYVGQLSEPKGVLHLVELIQRLTRTDVRLRIVGLGPQLHRALALAKEDERIQFYGWRNRQDLIEILTHTDALVMPSICYENLPTVSLEALSLGIPVITSDTGGAAELIQSEHNGWVFEAGNWKQLQSLIEQIADHKERISTMRQACLESVARLTVQEYAAALLALISEQQK